MIFKSAYLFVSHGSKDLRHGLNLQEVAAEFARALMVQPALIHGVSHGGPDSLAFVKTAYLELGVAPLHQEILAAAKSASDAGLDLLTVVPLFLSAGVHVTVDIPAEVALAQGLTDFPITVSTFLGDHGSLMGFLEKKFAQLGGEGKILLAHGTTNQAGRSKLELRAMMVGAWAAYTSMEPSLADQVQRLVAKGNKTIAIVPFFLFPGKILDRVHQQIQTLQKEYPKVIFLSTASLGTPQEIASIMVGELRR